jgi:hypothetical protein
MKVFISWSGDRSRRIASLLKTWLNDTIQQLEPWISSEDISKGARWSDDLMKELEATNVGILCLTPDNLLAPWILFESGALAKTIDKSRVCTYLYGLKPSDIEGPLVQFQATIANKNDTLALLHSLNNLLPDNEKRTNEQINRSFDRWWPDLKKAFNDIPTNESNNEQVRTDRDLLEEIVDIIRFQAKRSHLFENTGAPFKDINQSTK